MRSRTSRMGIVIKCGTGGDGHVSSIGGWVLYRGSMGVAVSWYKHGVGFGVSTAWRIRLAVILEIKNLEASTSHIICGT